MASKTPSLRRTRPTGSPASLPAARPFDWDAVRNQWPPPYQYASPTQRRLRGRSSIGTTVATTPSGLRNERNAKRVYRKVSWSESILDWANQLLDHALELPFNHLPSFPTLAKFLAGLFNVLHFAARYSQNQHLKDDDLAWEDMFGELGARKRDLFYLPSFNWAYLLQLLLITISSLNALYLFSRIKYYHMFSRTAPPSSPSIDLVDRDDLNHTGVPEPPSLVKRTQDYLTSLFWFMWRVAFNGKPRGADGRAAVKVQRLAIWAPQDGEMTLFWLYSPVHALLFQAMNFGNWLLISAIWTATTFQLYWLTKSFETLMKDQRILSAEVMHEYDEKFVYPHIMRVRRDVGVMTHEAEVISYRP